MPYFVYGAQETEYLCRRDRVLGDAIRRIGPVQRAVEPDLFCSLVNSIVGQQISTKAQATVWRRFQQALGCITPESIDRCTPEQLQALGISLRKAGYIKNAARRILQGELDLKALELLSDEQVQRALCALDGVGVWTAEMLMTFSMQRPDIVSFGDLAIVRGMRMLYRHRTITRPLFEKYRKRYSPYGTVASLYLWAIAGGALEGLTDPAAKYSGRKP